MRGERLLPEKIYEIRAPYREEKENVWNVEQCTIANVQMSMLMLMLVITTLPSRNRKKVIMTQWHKIARKSTGWKRKKNGIVNEMKVQGYFKLPAINYLSANRTEFVGSTWLNYYLRHNGNRNQEVLKL